MERSVLSHWGDSAATLSAIDRIKLVNPELADMEKGKDGLFRLKR